MPNVDEREIVVFDSGVGGLPYLQRLRDYLPAEIFSYTADTAHFPYGEKGTGELRSILDQEIERIIGRMNPKLIVVACNTASVVALSELRGTFGIPFVGVVPALKPAAEQTKNGRIGLLATRKTVEDPYTDRLEADFASRCEVHRYAGTEIVALVEEDFFSASERRREEVLRPSLHFFREKDIDRLVLACTHFLFLEEELKRHLGEGVGIVDSRDGVARQTMRILQNEKIARDGTQGDVQRGGMYITGKEGQERYRRFAELFGLSWKGRL
jgi:glutamate racemase